MNSDTTHPLVKSIATTYPLAQLDRLATDFEVPKAVKVALNADIKQATSAAITSALFATALLTLAQMISTADNPTNTTDTTTTTWVVLHFFTYSAIILNLVVSFTCLMTIKMCTDIPHTAQQAVARGRGLAVKVARGGVIPHNEAESHYRLLEAFGMSRGYRAISGVILPIMITLAFAYSFVALAIWVWATQSRLNASVTMLTVVLTSLCALFVFYTTVTSQGWH